MSATIVCPHCRAKYRIDLAVHGGKRIKCPKCAEEFGLPPPPVPPSPPGPALPATQLNSSPSADGLSQLVGRMREATQGFLDKTKARNKNFLRNYFIASAISFVFVVIIVIAVALNHDRKPGLPVITSDPKPDLPVVGGEKDDLDVRSEVVPGGVDGVSEKEIERLFKVLVMRVKPGQTASEVIDLLGRPHTVQRWVVFGSKFEIWTWKNRADPDNSFIMLRVENGIVTDGGTPGYDISSGFKFNRR